MSLLYSRYYLSYKNLFKIVLTARKLDKSEIINAVGHKTLKQLKHQFTYFTIRAYGTP